MTSVLNNPLILITDKRLNSVKELLPILEAVSQQNKSLLVIADDIDGEALSTMVVNKMRGILPVAAVKAPEFGDRKKAILEDIATLTGGTVISTEKGMRLDKFNPDWLGKAGKATTSKDTTTIIDAKGTEESIEQRVEEIRTQIDESNSPYEIEKLQERLAAFVGGVAIVHVGGHTEVEMKEKKDRVDDALSATKAALEEGILPGGGIALLNAAMVLTYSRANREMTEDESLGYDIISSAIERPFFKILENAGFTEDHIFNIEEEVKAANNDWEGYNPRTERYVNMYDNGIIDPTKVTRLALENAASVAGTMLITEAVVSKLPSENDNTPAVDPNMLLG
jgi:chaperonin GroEL